MNLALSDQLLHSKAAFDKMLFVVADFDKNSKRFTMKQEYNELIIDPHQFYFEKNVQSDYLDRLFEKVQDQEKIVYNYLGVRKNEKWTQPYYLK